MTNTLTQSTLAPRAQLFTLALAALVAPATTAFSASGTADVGTNYISDGTLMVPVGNPGNAPDPANNVGGTTFGGVPYGYSIGKYEVTNAQYALFLNTVDPTGANSLSLYNSSMGIEKPGSTSDGAHYAVKSGNADNGMSWADMPVNYVSFWDAARFCNWLTNGGTAGASTETGVYTLVGGTPTPTNSGVTRNVSVSEAGALTGTGDLAQTNGTVYAVPSEDEWYKAAYYNGDGTYRTYPTTKDGDAAPTKTEEANYYSGGSNAFGSPYLAEVDYYDAVTGANSHYGTFQQGGNLRELIDTIDTSNRLVRGGAYDSNAGELAALEASYSIPFGPDWDNSFTGFRISSLLITSVPEPGTYGILGGAAALLGAIALRRRPRRN